MKSRWIFAAALVPALLWGGQRTGWGAEEFAVPPPPLSPDYYPCMENCHKDQPTDPKPRKLEGDHTDVQLHHAEQFRWCLDCHDAQNRDKLHLQSGEKIDFSESYRLCGQCHGDKYRDWKKGIHGKRTGSWSGKKEYLLCAHCHNPHNPRFAPLKPEPAPLVPGAGTLPPQTAKPHGQPGGHGKPAGKHESKGH